MPINFYKYRQWNNNTGKMLRDQEVYFSFGFEYNDPFDSKVQINVPENIEYMLKNLYQTPLSKEIKEQLHKQIINNVFSPEQYSFVAYEVAKKTIMSSCFSSENLNILMWSHYANSHKGICLGFANVSNETYPAMKFNLGKISGDPPTIENGVFQINQVDYEKNEIVQWTPFQDDISIFMKAHTQKAKLWAYEKEYRIILAHKEYKKQILNFDRRFLTEIYLGAKISEKDKTSVMRIVEEEYFIRNIPVQIFQVHLSEEKYELNIEKIS